jgi:hypothetical protein
MDQRGSTAVTAIVTLVKHPEFTKDKTLFLED